jgi:hypothetical protein
MLEQGVLILRGDGRKESSSSKPRLGEKLDYYFDAIRLVQRGQVFLPFTVVIENVIGDIEAVVARRTRLAQQSHPGFLWRSSAFMPVAGNASTDYIIPGVLPTPLPRNDVV